MLRFIPNIQRNNLFQTLGIGTKIPGKDFSDIRTNVPCIGWTWENDRWTHGSIGEFKIRIKPWQKGRTHRIFAACPNCGKDVPFGRMLQHTEAEIIRDIKRNPSHLPGYLGVRSEKVTKFIHKEI